MVPKYLPSANRGDNILNFHAGDIVLSKAGRDKDKYFVVMEVVDTQYVLIADGDLRRVDSLKRKKCKHLTNTGDASELVKDKLLAGTRVTNPDLKKELAKYN